MKFSKKAAALASLTIASAICLTSAAGIGQEYISDVINVSAASDDLNDDWLHTDGSRIYDIEGNEVWLTGANWFGFNCSENCAHGLYAADCDEFLSNVAEKGINIIRFPISTELLYSWMQGTPNSVSSVQAGYEPPYVDINRDFVLEDGKTLKNSMEIFDVIMSKCKKYGLKALIDVHSPHSDNSGHNYELWYGKESSDGTMMTTEIWIDTLTWLAEKYNNDDTIIGYDLKNEPHGKRGYKGDSCPSDIAKWDGSTDENNWAYAATKCANSILKVNPHALIFIEGVEQYPKTDKGYTYDTPDIWEAPADVSPWYGAWWGGNLRGVRDFPVTPDSGTSQIVYSPHDYGPSVYDQTWFNKDFTTETLLEDYWYDTWAYINAEDIAPLLIGEWGGHMDGGKNQKWMELLRDYMIDNHINHTFWCLNPNSGDTGGLLSYDFVTWDDEKYGLFEKSLWQTSKSGKYIGLDHKTPLGSNGLTVSEYYSSYESSEGSNLDASGEKHPLKGGVIKPEPVVTTAVSETAATTESETAASTKVSSEMSSQAVSGELSKPSLPGDVTCDGEVDIRDVTLLNQYIVSITTLDEAAMANANVIADPTVDTKDLGQLKKYIVKLIDKF